MSSARLPSVIRALSVLAVVAGLGFGTAASTVAWNTDAFDAFEEDEGYVDLERDGDRLIVTLVEEEGAIPATIEGDALPLDEDLDEDRLRHPNALELYGGLPVDVGPTHVTLDLEGDPQDIDAALQARATELGLQVEEIETMPGVFHLWRLSDGDAAWRLSISHVSGDTLFNLQSVR